jgi:hypothetical protein
MSDPVDRKGCRRSRRPGLGLERLEALPRTERFCPRRREIFCPATLTNTL